MTVDHVSIVGSEEYREVSQDSTDTIFRSLIKATTAEVLQNEYLSKFKKENKSLKSLNTRLNNENIELKIKNTELNSSLGIHKDKYSIKNIICGLLNIIAVVCIAVGVNYLTSNPPNQTGSVILAIGVIANILAILSLYYFSK